MLVRILTITIILLAILFSKALSQDLPDVIKGAFKKCTVYKYDYKLGKMDLSSKFKEFEYLYDDFGKWTKRIVYNPDGSLDSKDSSLYDSQGRIDTIKGYRRIDTINIDYHYFYVYDNDGNLIQSGRASEDVNDAVSHPIYKKGSFRYSKKGLLLEKTSYHSDGTLEIKCKYKYDKKGNQIEEQITKADGKVFSKITYKYDKNRNIIEKIIHIQWDHPQNQKFKYKYDVQNNKIEEINYLKNLKEPTEKRVYIYMK